MFLTICIRREFSYLAHPNLIKYGNRSLKHFYQKDALGSGKITWISYHEVIVTFNNSYNDNQIIIILISVNRKIF